MHEMRRLLCFSVLNGAVWACFSPALLADDPSLKVTKEQEMAVVQGICKRVMADCKEKSEAEMKFYTNTIPGSTIV